MGKRISQAPSQKHFGIFLLTDKSKAIPGSWLPSRTETGTPKSRLGFPHKGSGKETAPWSKFSGWCQLAFCRMPDGLPPTPTQTHLLSMHHPCMALPGTKMPGSSEPWSWAEGASPAQDNGLSSQSVWPSGACLDQGGSTCVFRGSRLCKLGVSCGGWGATGVGREAGVPSQPQSFMVRDFKGSLLRTDTKELVEWIQLPWSKWTSMALQIKRSGHGASLSTAQATKEEVKSPLSAGNRGGSRRWPCQNSHSLPGS